MNRLRCSCSCLLGVTALFLCTGPLAACNVPVFRYALDRWRPQSFEVLVFHKGPLAAKEDAAADRLHAELKRLTPLLKLPKLTDSPDDRLSAQGPPLRIAFSVVRLKRDDPAERILVSMLLASEEDLPERKDPMAFAVFGRGHCLAGLVGAGLNAER